MLDKIIATVSGARFRNWFYGICTAFLAFAVGYDWIAPDKLPLWLGLLAAIMAIGGGTTATIKLAQQRRDGVL